MSSLKLNQGNDKSINVRNPGKPHKDRKDQDSFDIEGLQRLVKQLSNEIIGLKNNSGEGTSSRVFFRFPDKRNFPPWKQAPPEAINIQDYAMDNFCQVHKDNHSNKYFSSFINMFKLFVANKGNPPTSEGSKTIETEENSSKELSINLLWDLCILFEENEESELEEILTSQRSYNTRSKGSLAPPNSSPLTSVSVLKTNPHKKTIISKTITSDPTIKKKLILL